MCLAAILISAAVVVCAAYWGFRRWDARSERRATRALREYLEREERRKEASL